MCYPPRSPSYYWHIAEACYEDNNKINNYLKNSLPGVDCLETEHFTYKSLINLVPFKGINSWKVRLFREKGSSDLTVGFRGTEHFFNWVFDNVAFFITNPTSLHKEMEWKIGQWEKKHRGRVKVLVGHSAGGFHASHVFRGINLFRITFNAYKAERGPVNITWNLRTEGDKVSSWKIIGSVEDRYITVCKGGHTITEFKKAIYILTWEILSNMQKHPDVPYSFFLPTRSPRIVPQYYPSDNNNSSEAGSSLFKSLDPLITKKMDLYLTFNEANEGEKGQIRKYIENVDEEIDETKANFCSEEALESQGQDTVVVASQLAKLKEDDQACLTPNEKRDLKLGENVAKYQAFKGIVEIVRGVAECVDSNFGLNHYLVHAIDVSGAVAKCVFEVNQCKVIFDSLIKAKTALGLINAMRGDSTGYLQLAGQAVVSFYAFKEMLTLVSSQGKSGEDINALEKVSKNAEVSMEELFRKFEMLNADQKQEFRQILENIQWARKEIQNLAAELRQELKNMRSEIIGRMISQEGKKFQVDTIRYMQAFEEDPRVEVSADQKSIESFLWFFDIRMRHLNRDVWIGIVPSGPLVESSEFFKAPDYFSGLIAKSAGVPNVGNTYLYLQTLPHIDPLLKERFWVENHHSRLVQSITFAQHQGKNILNFMESSERVIENCLNEYRALRNNVRDKRNRMKRRKIEFQERLLGQNQVDKEKLESKLVGSTKFALSDFVHKEKIALDFSEEQRRAGSVAFYTNIGYAEKFLLKSLLKTVEIFLSLDLDLPYFIENNDIERHVEFTKERFSNRSIIALSQIISADASAQLHDLIIEVSKKTLSSDLVSKWAIEHVYSTSSPGRVDEIFWCKININRQTIYIPSGSAIQKEDLCKIPSPCEDSEYSSRVSQLYDNHLKLEKSRSRVVLPLDGNDQIPLLFPDNYIAYWGMKLGLFDISEGFFVPFYEFREEGDVWKLTLTFSFVKDGENPKKYARLVCARFDKTTVDAFQGNVNELLMQAFSGNEYQLGLPDKESYRLKKGMVAPHETRFPGLFALLQRKPSRSFIFNSEAYDNTVCKALEELIKTGTIEPKFNDWVEKTSWTPCAEYFEVAALLRQKREVESHLIVKYTKTYETLLGWGKLTSSLSQKKLQMLMWDRLSLPPPEAVLASPEIPIDILGFNTQIEVNPSTHITQMRKELEKLETFLSRYNSSRIREICNDMLDSRVFV